MSRSIYVIDVELVLIVFLAGFRHCAELTVAVTSGDDPHIVVLILFKLAASVLFNSSGGRGSFCAGRLIVAPCAGRIGGKEYIIAATAIDSFPGEFYIGSRTAGQLALYTLRPGSNKGGC